MYVLSVAAFTLEWQSSVVTTETFWPVKPGICCLAFSRKSLLVPGQMPPAKPRLLFLKALFQEPLKIRKWKMPKKQAAFASWSNKQQKQLIFKDFLMDETACHQIVHSGPCTESGSGSFTTEWVFPHVATENLQIDTKMWAATPAAVAWRTASWGEELGSRCWTLRPPSLLWERCVVTTASGVCSEAVKEGQTEDATQTLSFSFGFWATMTVSWRTALLPLSQHSLTSWGITKINFVCPKRK